MKLDLRWADKDDALLVADLSRHTFYETFAPDNTEADMNQFMNEQFTRGRLMMEVGARGNDFLLAYDGEEAVGYLKLRDAEVPKELAGRTALEIARLYVVQDCIGKGAGRQLMEAAIQVATERNKDCIWLGVWGKNHRAIRFYRKWGFRAFAKVKFLLGSDLQDDWLLVKDLHA